NPPPSSCSSTVRPPETTVTARAYGLNARKKLTAALAENDAAALVGPLTVTRAYLASDHPDLAARVDDVTRHTDRLRRHSGDRRQESRKPPER
ncbi:hypothetical protein ABZ590_38090, partial [Streptomyces hirsutus]